MYAPNIVLRNLFFMRRAGQTRAFDQVQLSKGFSEREYLTLYLQMIYFNLEYSFAVTVQEQKCVCK